MADSLWDRIKASLTSGDNTVVPTDPNMPITDRMSSIFGTSMEPLWEGPSEYASELAERIDPGPSLDRSVLEATLRGGAAGMVEGAGDLLSSFTSPFDIASGPLPIGFKGFHGTGKNFKFFDPRRYSKGDVLGRYTHFAEDPSVARGFAGSKSGYSPNARVIEAEFPGVKKAFDVEDITENDIIDLYDQLSETQSRGLTFSQNRDLRESIEELDKFVKMNAGTEFGDEASRLVDKMDKIAPGIMERAGFDAIRYQDYAGAGERAIAIPSPRQIKHAETREPMGLRKHQSKLRQQPEKYDPILAPKEPKSPMNVGNYYAGSVFDDSGQAIGNAGGKKWEIFDPVSGVTQEMFEGTESALKASMMASEGLDYLPIKKGWEWNFAGKKSPIDELDESLSALAPGTKEAVEKQLGAATASYNDPSQPWHVPQSTIDNLMANRIGPQKGSNPGGTFELEGKKFYVKEYVDPNQAQSEVLSNAIYRELGIPAPRSRAHVDYNGHTQHVAKLLDDAKPFELTAQNADKVIDGFAADILLGNWDATGMGLDNLVESGGKIYRVDQGGTLFYRAQGAKKPQSALDNIDEWTTLFTENPDYAKVMKMAGINIADDMKARILNQVTDMQNKLYNIPEFVKDSIPDADPAFIQEATDLLIKRMALLGHKSKMEYLTVKPMSQSFMDEFVVR